jgi:hypothetical protein
VTLKTKQKRTGRKKKMTIYKPERISSTRAVWDGNLILECPVSKTVRNNKSFVKSLSI